MTENTLTKLLSTKFKAGFSFTAWVRTSDKTACNVQGATIEDFLADAAQTRKFYEDQGKETKLCKFQLICNTCFGSGQIKDGTRKTGPYKGKPKFKKCPDCQSLGWVAL